MTPTSGCRSSTGATWPATWTSRSCTRSRRSSGSRATASRATTTTSLPTSASSPSSSARRRSRDATSPRGCQVRAGIASGLEDLVESAGERQRRLGRGAREPATRPFRRSPFALAVVIDVLVAPAGTYPSMLKLTSGRGGSGAEQLVERLVEVVAQPVGVRQRLGVGVDPEARAAGGHDHADRERVALGERDRRVDAAQF